MKRSKMIKEIEQRIEYGACTDTSTKEVAENILLLMEACGFQPPSILGLKRHAIQQAQRIFGTDQPVRGDILHDNEWEPE